ncbi:HD domain-containing protein [Candidatus Sumerlaeota bacterium]|nr:HD domain-containing protein [Candidatus Sumerlaeota bacterium]
MGLTDRQRRAITEWTDYLGVDVAHMTQVTRLALQFFDQLNNLHKEKTESRGLLEAAGLMHDVGFAIDEISHHKHSRDMILRQSIPGLSLDEIRAVASIARYHRKAAPSASHKLTAKLDPPMRRTVERLTAILRLADGLDRAHDGAVARVECRLGNGVLNVRVRARGDAGIDLMGGEKKKTYFETLFKCKVRFELAGLRSPGRSSS